MNDTNTLKPAFDRVQRLSLLVAGAALILSVVWAYRDPEQFFQSYLWAYMFWISLPLGCLAVLMLHHLVGGRWGYVIQRSLEAGTRTIPLMVVLFLPIAVGLPVLYEWTHADAVAGDELLQHKAPWLNMPFFLGRTVVYFVILMALTYLLNKWSAERDRSHNAGLTRRLRVLSGPGLVLWGATITFSSIDWVMSLEPHWYSTIFGILFMIGNGLATVAIMIVVLSWLWRRPPLSGVVERSHFHDLGNLMLAFVMLWAYISLSQFLIIWAGNLPEEIPWYLHRTQGGWQRIAVMLVIFHFVLPFLVLLSRTTKRSVGMLTGVAVALLFMRCVDAFWLVKPAFHPSAFHIGWLDIIAFCAIGGLWLSAFVWQLKSQPLLLSYDPRLEESIHAVGGLAHHETK